MSERPNIVLVTVDSLRADHCGCYGYEKETTPTLDRMAEDGVKFEHAIAPAPFTEQSMPAIFTGEYVMSDDPDERQEHIEKRRFIPELLSRKGYSTAGFSPNPFASRYSGFDRGFDEFYDFLRSESKSKIARTILSRLQQGDFIEALRLGANMSGFSVPGLGNQSIPLRSYEDMVLEWAEDADEPFFLWLFLLEVHSPYRPTREFRTMSLPKMLYLNLVRSYLIDRDPTEEEAERLLTLYDEAIRMTDDHLGSLMHELESYDPVYVVHSDHGEAFGEHENYGHNKNLYEENIQVPLVVSRIGQSETIDAPVSLRRLPGMIDEIATERQLTPEAYMQPSVVSRVGHEKIAVRAREWKHIEGGPGAGESYNLETDPNEQRMSDDGHVRSLAYERIDTHLRTLHEQTELKRVVAAGGASRA